LQWWIGDALGILTIAPLLLVYSSPSTIKKFSLRHRGFLTRMLVAITLLLTCSALILNEFFGSELITLAGNYLIIPFVLLIATQFAQKGATLTTFIISAF